MSIGPDLMRRSVELWLDSQGLLCDCDNGWRQFPPPGGAEKCDRCVLVEVGGIRVQWLREWRVIHGLLPELRFDLRLPAVGVTE